nr:uncharacterized protein LOC129388103 [Dermacentor andersoni]
MFCSGGTGSRVLQLTRLDSSHVHALCSCPPIQEEISPRDLGLENSRRQHPLCNTSGCLWLRGYLRSGDSNSNNIQSQRRSRAGPCDDFHEHVCRSRPQSIYEDGVARLMDAVKARLLGMRIGAGGNASDATKGTSERERQREPASLLRRCLDGATVVTGDDIASACGDVHGMVCPNAAPEAPLRISESFFQNNPNASVDDYAAFVKSVAGGLSWKKRSHQTAAKTSSRLSSARWMPRICRWVALSARCDLERRHQKPGLRPEARALYQQLWKVLYFAPLMGNKARPLVEQAYKRPPPQPQVQACLRIAEDVSRRKTAQAARASLSDAVDSLDDTMVHFVWEAGQVMRTLVPAWLSHVGPNVTNSTVEEEPDVRRADREHASQRLGAIEVHLLHDDYVSTPPLSNVSAYAWQAQYVAERKTLLVPLGLLGLLLNASAIIEPVLVPALGREVMRVLMPTSRGPYAWRPRNERRFQVLVKCVASGLDTDEKEALAAQTTLESALLEPLMMLYKRRLHEELGRGVRLHSRYGNAELFFVLWATSHCGKRDAETIVNGALRNSALFARAFQCSVNQAMWSGHRCSFWR